MRLLCLALLCFLCCFIACRKTDDITSAKEVKLSFSTDTLLFDTVFTSVGSASKRFKVFNKAQKGLRISNIRLSEGPVSNFSLIINGSPVNERSDLEIDGGDSISIFVKVNINPNDQNQPFIIQDSVIFNTNGNRQAVQLIAYGQNAVFYNGEAITTNNTFNNTLPYIIYKSVTVAEGITLTIQPGVKVLFHGSSSMNVSGTLRVAGTKSSPVIFASDRLETIFSEEPGQWNGIRFYSSSNGSSIDNALVKNAVVGIRVDSLSYDSEPKLLLTNTLIRNMSIAGFAGYNAEVAAFNNLFYNCGQYLWYGVGGGKYNLKQNTFAGYNLSFARRTPAAYFSDGDKNLYNALELEMVNNILWGSLAEEFLVDRKTVLPATLNISYNLIKTKLQTYKENFNLLAIDPLFSDPLKMDFRLKAESPAREKGMDLISDSYFNRFLSKDMNNLDRTFPSDLGCY